MGDSPTIPWRLLDIEILVEDHETGGKNQYYIYPYHFASGDLHAYCRLQNFSKTTFSKKFFQEYHQSRCQTVLIQIRPDILLGLRALTHLFGNGAGAHGIGKIRGVLT